MIACRQQTGGWILRRTSARSSRLGQGVRPPIARRTILAVQHAMSCNRRSVLSSPCAACRSEEAEPNLGDERR